MTPPAPAVPWLTVKRLLRSAALLRRYGTARKLRNLALAEWEVRRRPVVARALPYLLRVDPTNACTAACPYCWRTISPPLPLAALAVDALAEAFGAARDVCLLASFQMFGEPTLHPDLPEMVELVHRGGAATYVSTSLLVDDEERLARLVGSGLDLLTVSLDAATPETYRRMKPRADYDVARRNVERLFAARKKVARPPAIGFQALVTRHNEPELPALRDLARRLGADYFDAKPVLFLPDASWSPRAPRHRVDRLRRSRVACSMPWTSITLLSSGRYFPCCAFPGGDDLGPVGTPLADVWNGAALQAIRRGLRDGAPVAPCRDCPLGRLPRF